MPIAIVQALLGIRVIWRMMRTSGGERITPVERNVGATLAVARSSSHLTSDQTSCHLASDQTSSEHEQVSVIVPVLNERTRLEPCLDGLIAQGREVAEIIVVDGGSDDGTQ